METKNEVETLRLNNRRLEDEIQRLRPLARLAEVIALMEASNHRQFDELVKADRDYEDLDRKYGKLLDDYINNVKEFRERYEALLDRPVDPPPDGGINPR